MHSFNHKVYKSYAESEKTEMSNMAAQKEKDVLMDLIYTDNGGRRKNIDRRKFAYTFHIPERRCGTDRRDGKDRRTCPRHKE